MSGARPQSQSFIFPGCSPEAARWLTTNRTIKAIGLDTPSIDYGQSTIFESHQILFAKNIPAFENVGDMSALPAKGFRVIAMPMKISWRKWRAAANRGDHSVTKCLCCFVSWCLCGKTRR